MINDVIGYVAEELALFYFICILTIYTVPYMHTYIHTCTYTDRHRHTCIQTCTHRHVYA